MPKIPSEEHLSILEKKNEKLNGARSSAKKNSKLNTECGIERNSL